MNLIWLVDVRTKNATIGGAFDSHIVDTWHLLDQVLEGGFQFLFVFLVCWHKVQYYFAMFHRTVKTLKIVK